MAGGQVHAVEGEGIFEDFDPDTAGAIPWQGVVAEGRAGGEIDLAEATAGGADPDGSVDFVIGDIADVAGSGGDLVEGMGALLPPGVVTTSWPKP